MSHKLLLDYPIINTINYLTSGWETFKDHRFLGFIPTYPVEEGCLESLIFNNINYIACHVFFCDVNYLVEDKNFKNKPYILMFKGDDDFSYAKRFTTLKEAIDFFNKTDFFSKHIKEQCFWYN